MRSCLAPLGVVLSLGSGAVTARAVVVVANDWTLANGGPAGVALYGEAIKGPYYSSTMAFHLLQTRPSSYGSVVLANPVNAPLNNFTASFDFDMDGGTGADGFSFCYGDLPDAVWAEDGRGNGIIVRFVARSWTGGDDYIEVLYGGKSLGTHQTTLWRPTNQQQPQCAAPYTFRITVTPDAQLQWSFTARNPDCSTRDTWSASAALGTDWAPQPSWRFGLGARSGSLTMYVSLNHLDIRGDVAPILDPAPGPQTAFQDIALTLPLHITSLNLPVDNVMVAAAADDKTLIPDANLTLTGTGASRTLTLAGARGKFGTTTLHVNLTHPLVPGLLKSYAIPVTIQKNIPPGITALGSLTVAHGHTVAAPFGIGSAHWTSPDLHLAAEELPPAGGALVQDGALQFEYANATNASLVVTPRLDRIGNTQVKVTVTDGSGDSTSTTLSLAVQASTNAPTVAGGRTGLSVNENADRWQFGFDLTPGNLALGSQLTVEAWVRPTAFPDPTYNAIVAWGNFTKGQYALLGLQNTGRPSFATYTNDADPTTGPAAPLNAWTHVAAVINGRNVTFYLNGSFAASEMLPETPSIQNNKLYVGIEPTEWRYFAGQIDEVRIWSSARTAAQIQDSMDRKVAATEPGLVRYFDFDEGYYPFDRLTFFHAESLNLVSRYVRDLSPSNRPLILSGHPTYVPGVALDLPVTATEDQPLALPLVAATVQGTNAFGSAGIAQEIYSGPVGTAVSNLTSHPHYPDQRGVMNMLGDGLEVPEGVVALAGQRLSGYLLPPQTGNYTFWIASRNESELWLSTTDQPVNRVRIASSPAGGTGFRQWASSSTQRSAAISLEAGRRYYLEVLHQAGDPAVVGTTHLSVRWQLPDGRIEEPLPAYRLQPQGTSPAGAELSVVLEEPPAFGTATLTNGTLHYRPLPNFFGGDDLAYRVISSGRTSALGRLSLQVANVNDRPVAGSQTALILDGLGARLETTSSLTLSNRSFTLEAWAASTRPGTRQWLISQGTPENGRGLLFGFDEANLFKLAFYADDIVTPVAYADTNWHHWAGTYDVTTGQRRLYRDGVLVANDVATGKLLTDPGAVLHLGSQFGGAPFFGGGLDEVRVWNYARSEEDLKAAMGIPLRGNENGLIAYFRLDEGNGLIAHDTSAPKPGGLTYQAPITDNVIWITNTTHFGVVSVPRNSPGQEIFLPGFDLEGRPLTYRLRGANHGQLTGDGPVVTYRPALNYHGPDQITYTVFDGQAESDLATVTLDVTFINIPPSLSGFADQEVEEEDDPVTLRFTVFDVDTTADSLLLTSLSSNPTLLPESAITFGGSGTNRTVTLTPRVGEVGTARVTIEVSDGELSASRDFEFEVNPRLAFAALDLGVLTGQPYSLATDINEAGQVVGYTASDAQETHPRGFFYTGYGPLASVLPIATLGGDASRPFGVNAAGLTVGAALTTGDNTNAFATLPPRTIALTNLGTLIGGSRSLATAVNDEGLIVGYAQIGDGTYHAFSAGLAPLTDLGVPNGAAQSFATAVNGARTIAGYAVTAGDVTNAFTHTSGGFAPLPLPTGAVGAVASAINDAGDIGGHLYTSAGTMHAALAVSNTWSDLGDLFGGGAARITDLNRFRQAVGTARDTNGHWQAFLFERGRGYNLSSLLPEDSGWTLTEARAINDQGQIVGVGQKDGATRAFVLLPATEIGRRVFRPEGALPTLPQIELLQSSPGDNNNNAFFWSERDQKLFAIRPVAAVIRWRTGVFTTFVKETPFGDQTIRQTFTNEVLLPTLSVNVWPKDPDLHVAGSPAEAEPKVPDFLYSFVNLIYSTVDGAVVDKTTKIFTAPTTGYSVLHYLQSNGLPPDSEKQPNRFSVTRTIRWDDPLHLITNLTAVVGAPLTHPAHDDHPGRNGYLMSEDAYYDGAGENAAYVRNERRGPILPVNASTNRDDFVVTWYHRNRLGVAWPDLPVKYALQWPTNAPHIVIASGLGSGTLPIEQTTGAMIYNQADASLPGFNPNEEHALLAPAGGGVGVFALRNDLNAAARIPASEPFVLLKYRDAASQEWRLQVFRVVATEDPYVFRYPGTAGTEIQPPMPLTVLPTASHTTAASGPWWQDHTGRFYARAAGEAGGEADLIMHYFYPLQAGFAYDLDSDGLNDVPDGTELSWLDRLPGGVQGTPVDVTFQIRWPSDVPTLAIGETLTTASHGLPDVLDAASLQVVYDALDASGGTPIQQLARLFDPLSARTVTLPTGFEWPEEIQRSMDAATGNEIFPDLPFYLRARLFHDPLNHQLGFRGFTQARAVGPALSLINVMTERERDRIQELDETPGSAFDQVVTGLYQLTRNPNRLDIDPRDGHPDDALLIGLAYDASGTNVVAEQLGGGPKALTAGLPVHTALGTASRALRFDGSTGTVEFAPSFADITNEFTVEFWARPAVARATTPETVDGYNGFVGQHFAIHPVNGLDAYGSGHATVGISVGTNGVTIAEHGDSHFPTPLVYDQHLATWTHIALVYQNRRHHLYLDGELIRVGQASAAGIIVHPSQDLGGQTSRSDIGRYAGDLDEIRIWDHAVTEADLRSRISRHLIGNEAGLAGYWRLDAGSGTNIVDSSSRKNDGVIHGGVSWVSSEAPIGILPRFQVLAENNDPSLGGLPVSLHVIRVEGGPYLGSLQVILPDNVLDERVTLRHSADFAGDPRDLEFEWYYHPAEGGAAPAAPDPADPTATGWIRFPQGGKGINDITIGEGELSSLITLSDNWFFLRYRGYEVDGATPWSAWIGNPASTVLPVPMLVEGWVKRVLAGINLFDQRNSDFSKYPVNTLASALAQAGPRYEGDIALNPDAIDGPGLIQIYQTVLHRGRTLSIDGTPPVDYEPADSALLLAAGTLADLYMLFGNEAFADAADPTIGLNPTLPEIGSLASSIFAFENQVDSLLEEELSLLRGRDDRSAGVGAAPVYNRLFWNFTRADGEVAYTQTYNMSDYNSDGFVNALDAAILFPQGHGDAWGHYLTALTTYYALLRHPNFTWANQTESVTIGGVPIEVGYLHERKFAAAAVARTRTGAEITERSYRWNYDEDPAGQWSGYADTDPDRAWGVAEWGWRAGQGAYFDWLTGNAILPATDPDPTHTGIRKIDRTTVRELSQLVGEATKIQDVADSADLGLNPMGVARDSVPFDLDPNVMLTDFFRDTHFDQIYERALAALGNAMTTFRQASELTDALRSQADSEADFGTSVTLQELAYRNQLIELFGYPYAGDIGPGTPYPSGYIGPDLYHWMYVDTLDVTAGNDPRSQSFTGLFKPFQEAAGRWGFVFSSDTMNTLNVQSNEVLEVEYPVSIEGRAFQASAAWGTRRAEGALQNALRGIVQAQAGLRQASVAYEDQVKEIEEQLELLEARYGLRAEQIRLLDAKEGVFTTFNALILAAKTTHTILEGLTDDLEEAVNAAALGNPFVVGFSDDPSFIVRAIFLATGQFAKSAPEKVAEAAEIAEFAFDFAKDAAEVDIERQMESAAQDFEVKERTMELEAIVRGEAGLRLGIFQQAQALIQAVRTYESTLAEAQRVLEQRLVFRSLTAGSLSQTRYRDLAFRIFRSDALEKYDTQFELASRYVYLAARAFDYEVNLPSAGAADLAAQVVRERNLGELRDGVPTAGRSGLASILARLRQNFDVLKPSLGLNNDRDENARFSLRSEWLRIQTPGTNGTSDAAWVAALQQARVTNLWEVPEFRQFCRPFAPESAGPQPGLVFSIAGTSIQAGKNFFGWPLSPLDSAYDPSEYSTRIRSVAVWLTDYDQAGLAAKPRVYLLPVGADVLRSPDALDFAPRAWRVVEQKIPMPFPVPLDSGQGSWLPETLAVSSGFAEQARHSAFRAYHDAGFDPDQFHESSRLIGRSVWNTRWLLIIPGSYLLGDADAGLDRLIHSVSDIKLYFQTYSFSGH